MPCRAEYVVAATLRSPVLRRVRTRIRRERLLLKHRLEKFLIRMVRLRTTILLRFRLMAMRRWPRFRPVLLLVMAIRPTLAPLLRWSNGLVRLLRLIESPDSVPRRIGMCRYVRVTLSELLLMLWRRSRLWVLWMNRRLVVRR